MLENLGISKSRADRRAVRAVATAVAIALLAGCGSGPSEPAEAEENELLAVELEGLGLEALGDGDFERALSYAEAAASVRLGVRPSVLVLKNGATSERYDAFVELVDRQGTGKPEHFSRRSLIAWRRTDKGVQSLFVGSPAANGAVTHPLTLGPGSGPIAGAIAYFFDAAAQTRWIGVGGPVVIEEKTKGAKCPKPGNGPKKFTCTSAVFVMTLDVQFAQFGRDFKIDDTRRRQIAADRQDVNGVLLSYSCVSAAIGRC